MALRRFIGDAANDCDLRYQGQLYDAESGLYYNRHRYYDPEIWQYISPDPIGLGGSNRPQAYASNPLTFCDPLGLAKAGCPAKALKDIHEKMEQNGSYRWFKRRGRGIMLYLVSISRFTFMKEK